MHGRERQPWSQVLGRNVGPTCRECVEDTRKQANLLHWPAYQRKNAEEGGGHGQTWMTQRSGESGLRTLTARNIQLTWRSTSPNSIWITTFCGKSVGNTLTCWYHGSCKNGNRQLGFGYGTGGPNMANWNKLEGIKERG